MVGPGLADLFYRRICILGGSVRWVLIWLNLSTSSPVCLPLSLQLSGFTTQACDWLTSAWLAGVFMHVGLIISRWPWVYPTLSFLSPTLCLGPWSGAMTSHLALILSSFCFRSSMYFQFKPIRLYERSVLNSMFGNEMFPTNPLFTSVPIRIRAHLNLI